MLAGRRDVFAALVERHKERVYGLCLSLLSDLTLAEDAAQESFLKAFKALSGFRRGASFSTWLHRIASNTCLDALRKKTRQKTDSLEKLIEEEGGRIEMILSRPGEESAVEARDLAGRFLALLSPQDRLLLTLRETQGLSYEELAEVLGCSLNAVKSRLRRAREELTEKARHFLTVSNV